MFDAAALVLFVGGAPLVGLPDRVAAALVAVVLSVEIVTFELDVGTRLALVE